jgi:hypothetical protein
MAYMSQEHKAQLAPGIKAVLKKYGMKGTIGVRHYSTLVVNIQSGKLDVIANWFEKHKENVWKRDYSECKELPEYLDVNHQWIDDHYTGEVAEFLNELCDAMMIGNHNNSDVYTDYHDVGWYIDINVGQWDKPYKLAA